MSDERETLYHVIVLFFVFIKLINYKIENYYQSSHLQFINWMVFTKSCFVIDDNWYLGVQIYMYIYIYNIYIYIYYFAEKKPFQDDRRIFFKVSFFIITYRIVSYHFWYFFVCIEKRLNDIECCSGIIVDVLIVY